MSGLEAILDRDGHIIPEPEDLKAADHAVPPVVDDPGGERWLAERWRYAQARRLIRFYEHEVDE